MPLTPHTPPVAVNPTDKPELAVAAVGDSVVPKYCVPGFGNVIVWVAFGVTLLEAFETMTVLSL